jgi:hypothetical protein
VAFSRNARYFAYAIKDQIKVWDDNYGNLFRTFEVDRVVSQFSFSPDESCILAQAGGKLYVWSLNADYGAGAARGDTPILDPNPQRNFVRLLDCNTRNNVATLWDGRSDSPDWYSAVKLSGDCHSVLTSCYHEQKGKRLWSTSRWEVESSRRIGYSSAMPVDRVALSADGSHFLTYVWNNGFSDSSCSRIALYSLDHEPHLVREFKASERKISSQNQPVLLNLLSACFSPDGSTIVVSDTPVKFYNPKRTGSTTRYDCVTGNVIATAPGSVEEICAVSHSNDRAVCVGRRGVVVADLITGGVVAELTGCEPNF